MNEEIALPGSSLHFFSFKAKGISVGYTSLCIIHTGSMNFMLIKCRSTHCKVWASKLLFCRQNTQELGILVTYLEITPSLSKYLVEFPCLSTCRLCPCKVPIFICHYHNIISLINRCILNSPFYKEKRIILYLDLFTRQF